MNFDIQVPNKALYKFNEVTSITGVKPYVLRFWETEFPQLKPQMNESGQKIYRLEDVEAVQKIKKLLFEDKLSIPEAKLELEKDGNINFTDGAAKEVAKDQNNSTPNLQSRSEELKIALEQIIEKNSRPINRGEEQRDIFSQKAVHIANKVKSELKAQSQLLDKDIVNLVTAKKKLTVLISKIDSICNHHNWN